MLDFNSFCREKKRAIASFFSQKNFHIDPPRPACTKPQSPGGPKLAIRVRSFVRSFVRADLFAAEFAIEHQSKSWWVCRKDSVHHSSVHLSPVSLVPRSRSDRGKGRPYPDELCTHRTVRETIPRERVSPATSQRANATPGQRPAWQRALLRSWGY